MLYNKIPQIIGGSALAGFGLSFGRDVYRSAKKSAGAILLVIIAVVMIFLPRQSVILLVRNYRSNAEAFLYRIGAVVMYVAIAPISFFILSYFLSLIFLIPFLFPSIDTTNKVLPLIITTLYANPISEYLFLTWVVTVDGLGSMAESMRTDLEDGGNENLRWAWGMSLAGPVFLLLLISGYRAGKRHRKIREAAWAAERHNKAFLSSVGLQELANEQFKDSEGNLYRLENEFEDRIELFAIGRRNRRGYLHFDETGKFTEWSGLVTLK